jgi:hypothetical protein
LIGQEDGISVLIDHSPRHVNGSTDSNKRIRNFLRIVGWDI